MGTLIGNAIQNLREYQFVLPYATAVEFAYLNSPIFKERPFFPKYFAPFKDMRNRAYYYINDRNQYTDEMLEDDERQKALAIIYIFIAGVTEQEIEMIRGDWAGSSEFQMLLRQDPIFEMDYHPYGELIDAGTRFSENYGYQFPIDFDKAMSNYDIPHDDTTMVAIFSAENSH